MILLLLVPLAACQTLGSSSKPNVLQRTLNQYEAAIRWGVISNAYAFVKPEMAAETFPEHTRFKNIRVTGYDVVAKPANLTEDLIRQIVWIRYVFVDQQIVREINDEQLWEYDEAENKWWRVNPIPEFR
ncbi:MAG: hypothetical protein PVG66_08820 [Chromatiales bacterium]|jgi:hypothetical protein